MIVNALEAARCMHSKLLRTLMKRYIEIKKKRKCNSLENIYTLGPFDLRSYRNDHIDYWDENVFLVTRLLSTADKCPIKLTALMCN